MKLGEIESIIWKEFSAGPPEQRAAEKLFAKGITELEIWTYLQGRKSVLPDYVINNTLNELRNLERRLNESKRMG